MPWITIMSRESIPLRYLLLLGACKGDDALGNCFVRGIRFPRAIAICRRLQGKQSLEGSDALRDCCPPALTRGPTPQGMASSKGRISLGYLLLPALMREGMP